MINVHVIHEQEYLDKGYVEIERSKDRIEFAHPDRICLRKMRTGLCQLDKDHRGRCSTVTFYCDACSKYRRGTFYRAAYDSDGAIDVVFCWFCCEGKEAKKYEQKMYAEWEQEQRLNPDLIIEDEELVKEQFGYEV